MCTTAGPLDLVQAGLDGLTGADPAGWTDDAVRADLPRLLAAYNRLTAVISTVVGTFDARGLSELDALRTTRTWLTAFGRMSQGAASGWLARGRLMRELPALCAAAGRGEVSAEHLRKVGDLVERLGPAAVRDFDAILAELAAAAGPAEVQKACERIAAHVDPDGPEPDPQARFDRRGLTLSRSGGMLALRGQLDDEGGATLLTALDAMMTPPAGDDARTPAQRRADALVELARLTLGHGDVPTIGGVRPHLGILITPQALLGQCYLDLTHSTGTHGTGTDGTGTDRAATDPDISMGDGDSDRSPRRAALMSLLGQGGLKAAPCGVDDPPGDHPTGHGHPHDGGQPHDGEQWRYRASDAAPEEHALTGPDSEDARDNEDRDNEDAHHDHGGHGAPNLSGHRSTRPAGGASAAGPPAGGDPLTRAGIPPLPEPPWLNWVGEIPTALAQRLSCDCEVWRAVLDPQTGLPLDVGRNHRVVPHWIRKALHARDRGCRWPGCQAPAGWTDAHHLLEWYFGGETKIDNLLLLCRYHHVRVHEGQWRIELDRTTGEVWVYRPDGSPYELGPSRPWTGPATRRGDPTSPDPTPSDTTLPDAA